MRAVVVPVPGGPEVLRPTVGPDPEPPDRGTLLVRVLAATVNPTDIAARRGRTRGGAAPPYVLGWDFAGEVLEVGAGVRDLRAGDRVAGMIPWYDVAGAEGSYATHVVVRPAWLARIPGGLDPVRAATVPLNGLTAMQALSRLAVPRGGQLLVTGVSGAVGGFAAQLAAQSGLQVTAACAAGDQKWARRTGAVAVVAGRDEVPTDKRFGHVLDAVPMGHAVLPCVAEGGTVVSTRRVDPADDRRVEQLHMMVQPDHHALRQLLEAAAEGRLMTRVAQVLPLEEAARAHALVEAGGLRGKVVLRP